MPDDIVSNEDLDQAALEVETEEEPAEEDLSAEEEEGIEQEVSEDVPPEPDDNAERSQLGRKVKGLSDDFRDFQAKVLEQLAEISGQSRRYPDQVQEEETELEFDPDEPLTYKDVEKILERREARKVQQESAYVRGYKGTLSELGRSNEDLHDAVMERVMTDHNIRHSDNPILDARLNYANAQAEVLREMASNKTPFTERKPSEGQPLGTKINSSSKKTKVRRKVILDKYAQDFVKRTKMKDEDVEETLATPGPAYLPR